MTATVLRLYATTKKAIYTIPSINMLYRWKSQTSTFYINVSPWYCYTNFSLVTGNISEINVILKRVHRE